MKRFFSILLLTFLLCTWNLSAVQAATLTDLQNHWASGDVQQLIARGAIGGYPDGTFRPDATITRAEFSKILRQSLGLSAVTGNDFTDTAAHWAVTDIHTLVDKQIIVPAEYGNQYGPDSAITRREIAIMLVRAMGLNDSAVALSGQATSFSDDADIHAYDKGYLYLAKELGLVGGYEDGAFRPNNRATRAEASVMIVRLLKLQSIDNNQTVTSSTPQPDDTTATTTDSANQNTTPASNQQSDKQVTYQLTLQNTALSKVNALGEQYLTATMQLAVQNNTTQAVSISQQQWKTIITYSSGAQVTAMQPEFSQSIAAGSQETISTTISILLPNNQVANMVLGNQITNIQVQVNTGTQTRTFADVEAALLAAVQ